MDQYQTLDELTREQLIEIILSLRLCTEHLTQMVIGEGQNECLACFKLDSETPFCERYHGKIQEEKIRGP